MSTKLVKKGEHNGIRYAELSDLITYLDKSFDSFVSSEQFSSSTEEKRRSYTDSYRGIRQSIKELKGNDT